MGNDAGFLDEMGTEKVLISMISKRNANKRNFDRLYTIIIDKNKSLWIQFRLEMYIQFRGFTKFGIKVL